MGKFLMPYGVKPIIIEVGRGAVLTAAQPEGVNIRRKDENWGGG